MIARSRNPSGKRTSIASIKPAHLRLRKGVGKAPFRSRQIQSIRRIYRHQTAPVEEPEEHVHRDQVEPERS